MRMNKLFHIFLIAALALGVSQCAAKKAKAAGPSRFGDGTVDIEEGPTEPFLQTHIKTAGPKGSIFLCGVSVDNGQLIAEPDLNATRTLKVELDSLSVKALYALAAKGGIVVLMTSSDSVGRGHLDDNGRLHHFTQDGFAPYTSQAGETDREAVALSCNVKPNGETKGCTPAEKFLPPGELNRMKEEIRSLCNQAVLDAANDPTANLGKFASSDSDFVRDQKAYRTALLRALTQQPAQ